MRLSPLGFKHRLAILCTAAEIFILSLAMLISVPALR
jgi:hypothetical protein